MLILFYEYHLLTIFIYVFNSVDLSDKFFPGRIGKLNNNEFLHEFSPISKKRGMYMKLYYLLR